MLAGQAVQTGMNLLGGDKDIDPGSAAGFKDSGWQDTSVVEPRQPTNTIVNANPDAQGKMSQVLGGLKTTTSGINKGLGNNIGKAASQLAGDAIGNAMQRRHSKKNFQRLKDEGLTPVEIAGSGGGTVQSQGNTLGSGPATQIKTQQEFTAGQAQLDRDAAQKRAETTAAPAGRQARVSERVDVRNQQLHPARLEEAELNLRRMRVDIRQKNFDLENMWPMKFASMGPENGLFALAAYDAGLDFESILTMRPGQNREDVKELIDWYQKFKSIIGKEAHGITEFVEWVGDETGIMGRAMQGAGALMHRMQSPAPTDRGRRLRGSAKRFMNSGLVGVWARREKRKEKR